MWFGCLLRTEASDSHWLNGVQLSKRKSRISSSWKWSREREKWQSFNAASVSTPHIYKTIFLANDHPITLCEFPPQLDPHPTWTGKAPNFVTGSPKQHSPLNGSVTSKGATTLEARSCHHTAVSLGWSHTLWSAQQPAGTTLDTCCQGCEGNSRGS